MEIYGYPIFRQCQVTLDQEVKVLYPQKSCSFDVTRASDKLMKVHCRDDPSIFGTRRVEDGLTLGASESFGSFGVEVADFLQKDREEVEREKSLLQERKRRMEKELEKQRRIAAFCRFPFFSLFAAVHLGLLVLWTRLDPEDVASPELVCFGMVLSLAGLCIYSCTAPGTWWSQLPRSTTESVGILCTLRLFLPGKPYCDRSHCEVCNGWILVDYAGSWAAVLLHVDFHVWSVAASLLRGAYQVE